MSTLRRDALSLPNLLTYARVLMIPLVLWLLQRGTERDCIVAAIVFVIAALTDMLDGFLARKLNLVSVIGKLLDPLADKLMVMAAMIELIAMKRLETWVVIVLLSREMAITSLRALAAAEGMVIAAGEGGKQKTAFQMIGLCFLMLGVKAPNTPLGLIDLGKVGHMLLLFSLVLSITSALQYTFAFGKTMNNLKA